jgi:hypothetical protein
MTMSMMLDGKWIVSDDIKIHDRGRVGRAEAGAACGDSLRIRSGGRRATRVPTRELCKLRSQAAPTCCCPPPTVVSRVGRHYYGTRSAGA